MFTRRSLLGGFGAVLCAPAIVRASSLMSIYAPEPDNYIWSIRSDGIVGIPVRFCPTPFGGYLQRIGPEKFYPYLRRTEIAW